MLTSEQVYYEGAHFAHIVAYDEHRRIARRAQQSRKAADRGRG